MQLAHPIDVERFVIRFGHRIRQQIPIALELDGSIDTADSGRAGRYLLDITKERARSGDARKGQELRDRGFVHGARNLPSSQCIAPEGVNVYDILRHQTLVLTQAAVASITAALKLEAGAE